MRAEQGGYPVRLRPAARNDCGTRAVVEVAAAEHLAAEPGLDPTAGKNASVSWETVLDVLPVAVVTVDAEGTIGAVNLQLERLTGYDRAGLVGQPLEVLVPHDQAEAHRRHRHRYNDKPTIRPMGRGLDIECRRKDGSIFAADITLGPLPGGDVVCTIRDDGEQRAAIAALRHQALHDPLTGLANRTLLEDHLTMALRRARRRHRLVGVLFIDLDHFKPVNDLLGHAAGDSVLRDVAARFEAVVRPGDSVGRYGGDEFVVICDDLETDTEAEAVAQRLLASAHGLDVQGPAMAITASIGVAVGDGHSSGHDLLANADAAAYRAKATGRDRYVTTPTTWAGGHTDRPT